MKIERGWIFQIIISFILVLVLPFEMQMSSPMIFVYISPIIHLSPTSYVVPELNDTIRALSIVIIFVTSLPAIGINYIISTRPKGESIKKPLTFALILTQPILQYVLIPPLISYISMGADAPLYTLTFTFLPAILACNWTFLFFIVIPFIRREGKPMNASDLNTDNDYFLYIIRKPSKVEAISIILSFCIIFIPILAIPQHFYYYRDLYDSLNLTLISASGMVLINSGESVYVFFSTMSELFYATNILAIGLHIKYIQSVLQYLQGLKKRSKCITDGIIAVIALALIPYIPFPLFDVYFNYTIPIPLIFIIGLVVIYIVEPIPFQEKLWDVKPIEKKLKYDGKIKVPLHYIIWSKLRHSKTNEQDYEGNKKDDVFGTDEVNTE
ncbi:MAG: hypothetical protein ACFFF4_00230 [Candidatus Thorarchaeota archaeon]